MSRSWMGNIKKAKSSVTAPYGLSDDARLFCFRCRSGLWRKSTMSKIQSLNKCFYFNNNARKENLQRLSLRLCFFIPPVYACDLSNAREISVGQLKFMNVSFISNVPVALFVRLFTCPSERPEYPRPLKAVAWEDRSSHG